MAKQEKLFEASNRLKSTNQVPGIQAILDHIIVTDMSFGARKLSSGIWMLGDDGKTDGIRPRWGKVYKVGPQQTDVKPGQWVFVEHGRWSRGIELDINGEVFAARRIDPKCIIFVSDEEPPEDDTMSTAVHAEKKTRTQYE